MALTWARNGIWALLVLLAGGGVAYVGVWGYSLYPTKYSPALVYYDNLAGSPTYIAEANEIAVISLLDHNPGEIICGAKGSPQAHRKAPGRGLDGAGWKFDIFCAQRLLNLGYGEVPGGHGRTTCRPGLVQ